MTYEIVLTKDAERDLEDIYRYIAKHDSPVKADHVLDRMLQATEALRTLPDRGSCPKELRSLGTTEYRQPFFNPYRPTYRGPALLVGIYDFWDSRPDTSRFPTSSLLGPYS